MSVVLVVVWSVISVFVWVKVIYYSVFYYKIMQINIEIELIIINCGIIYTIKPHFSKFNGDFGGDFSKLSDQIGLTTAVCFILDPICIIKSEVLWTKKTFRSEHWGALDACSIVQVILFELAKVSNKTKNGFIYLINLSEMKVKSLQCHIESHILRW